MDTSSIILEVVDRDRRGTKDRRAPELPSAWPMVFYGAAMLVGGIIIGLTAGSVFH